MLYYKGFLLWYILKQKIYQLKAILLFSNFLNEAKDDPLDKNSDALDDIRDKIKDTSKKISDVEDVKKRKLMALNLDMLKSKQDMLQSQRKMLRFKSKM